jgi:hypothetical protein
MSSAPGHTLPAFDCHRLGVEEHVAENVCFRRFHVFGDRKIRIAAIPPENVVLKGDLPGLVLRIRRNNGDLPAGRTGRELKQITTSSIYCQPERIRGHRL